MTQTAVIAWEEPEGCTTPRGWLRVNGTCVGNYLDYGPEHYRSPHQYCRPDHLCPDCQPGTVHAVRYPAGPGTPCESRYFETITEAREWIETGSAAANDHLWQVIAAGVALAKFTDETEAQDYAGRTHIPGLTVDVVQAY